MADTTDNPFAPAFEPDPYDPVNRHFPIRNRSVVPGYNQSVQAGQGKASRGFPYDEDSRPAPFTQPISEQLSPTMGAYHGTQQVLDVLNALKEGNLGEAAETGTLLAAGAAVPGAKGRARPVLARELDPLGYYSQALETAKALQRKEGPAQGFLNDLIHGGVKKAEIEATGLPQFLASNPHLTREQLVDYLRANRVQVRETAYGARLPSQNAEFEARMQPLRDELSQVEGQMARASGGRDPSIDLTALLGRRLQLQSELTKLTGERSRLTEGDIKWKRAGGRDLLLDPENPTNRESVISLAHSKRYEEIKARVGEIDSLRGSANEKAQSGLLDERGRLMREIYDMQNASYSDPHFPDVPNYLFHNRTGIYTDAQGQKWLLGDEFQSTRAQAIRDSKTGPRDEEKIADLQKRYAEADAIYQAALAEGQEFAGAHGHKIEGVLPRSIPSYDTTSILNTIYTHGPRDISTQAFSLSNKIHNAANTARLLSAEIQAATAAPVGHPLVNDMSQVNLTGLRRLLQQAHQSDVAGIALTPGELQNERYNLVNHVQALRYDPYKHSLDYIPAENAQWRSFGRHETVRGEWRRWPDKIEPEQLPGYIGKEVAAHLLAQPRQYVGAEHSLAGAHTLENLRDIDIGGQGMREYYDRQYPAVLNKELKRLDPNYPGQETVQLEVEPSYQFHGFRLTDKARAEIAKGLPLFSAGVIGAGLAARSKEEEDELSLNPFGSTY